MMSTNSVIAIKENNKFKCIYCHWDGHIHYNGSILNKSYQDVDKINRLIDLGDISSLGEEVEPNADKEHTFFKKQEGVTLAYHRDREEDFEDVAPKICSSLEEIRKNYSGPYFYYYDINDSNWYVAIGRQEPILLKEALLNEAEE